MSRTRGKWELTFRHEHGTADEASRLTFEDFATTLTRASTSASPAARTRRLATNHTLLECLPDTIENEESPRGLGAVSADAGRSASMTSAGVTADARGTTRGPRASMCWRSARYCRRTHIITYSGHREKVTAKVTTKTTMARMCHPEHRREHRQVERNAVHYIQG